MKDSRQEVLDFWFVETAPAQWFQENPVFDDMVRDRFLSVFYMAMSGVCDPWMQDVDGCLALVLVFDQFPRNMFRGNSAAYDGDEKALSVARHAIQKGYDQLLVPFKRRFLYLPFEHSEQVEHQAESVRLFEMMKEEDPLGYEYALRHQRLIARFGRFPSRNAALGRCSTPDEHAYLAEISGHSV